MAYEVMTQGFQSQKLSLLEFFHEVFALALEFLRQGVERHALKGFGHLASVIRKLFIHLMEFLHED